MQIRNQRFKALNQARERAGYKQPMDPKMSQDFDNSKDKNTAFGQTKFENPLTILNKRSNIVKDAVEKTKIRNALDNARQKYRYSSGNLRDRIEGNTRPNNKMEET